MKIVKCI